MAVEYIKRLAGPYVGDGTGQKTFSFGFLIFDESDVYVAVAASSDSEPSDLQQGTDYTVSMNADQSATPGGTITLTSETGLAKDAVLVIGSAVDYTQTLDLTNYTRFAPERITTELDRIVVMIQQIVELLGRVVQVPPTSSISPSDLFFQLLNAAESAAQSAEDAAASLAACEQIRQLILLYSWDIPHVVESLREVEQYPYDGLFAVGGYGDPGRKGQNISNRYVKAEGSTELRTLGERFADVVNVKDFGAKGDGTTDDTEAIQAAFDYAVSKPECTVVFPAGTYPCDGQVEVIGTGVLDVRASGAEIYSRKTTYNTTQETEFALRFSGVEKTSSAVTYEGELNVDGMVVDNIWTGITIEEGDLIKFTSSQLIDTEPRTGGWHESFLARVSYIDSENKIHLSDPIPVHIYPRFYANVSVDSVISSTQIKLNVSAFEDTSRDFMRAQLLKNGKSYWILEWDQVNRIATLASETTDLTEGDTLTFSHFTAARVFRPIKVSVHGLKLYRDLVTNATAGDHSFIGMSIAYANESSVIKCEVSNFPNQGLNLQYCYRPVVRGGRFSNANRIYNGNDGTGNGILVFGCSYAVIDLNFLKGCRSGCTTSGQDCRSVGCVFTNNVVMGMDKPNYVGEVITPTADIDNNASGMCYGMGGHGDALRCIYKGNVIFDAAYGFKVRDEDSVYEGNTVYGVSRVGFAIYNMKGGVFSKNTYWPTIFGKNTGSFASISAAEKDSGYNPLGRIVFDGNIGYNVNAQFIKADTGGLQNCVYSNLRIRNNYCKFRTDSDWPLTGFGYTETTSERVILKNCLFENNTAEYEPDLVSNDRLGFASYNKTWTIPLNSYIQVDRDLYLVRLGANETVEIDLPSRLSPTIGLSLLGVSRYESCAGIVLTPGGNSDQLTGSLTNLTAESAPDSSIRYVTIASADAEKITTDFAGYNRIFVFSYHGGSLCFVNRYNDDFTLLASIKRLF